MTAKASQIVDMTSAGTPTARPGLGAAADK
jgi:hypothetical protein